MLIRVEHIIKIGGIGIQVDFRARFGHARGTWQDSRPPEAGACYTAHGTKS